MKILTYILGVFSANCYLVYDENSKKACLIDPAIYDVKVMKTINEKELSIEYIILTHGHIDHILGATAFKEKTGAKIGAHRLEVEYLVDPEKSMTSMYSNEIISPDILLKENDILNIGEVSFKVIHTPGHTKGSCCFVCESKKVIFSGDTLFKGSIGRSDLYGGDYKSLLQSLQKLKSMNQNYKIYTGHGDTTTLENEIGYNIYFRENTQ
jgi:glyoxylase-like metal-dependent hydrolase (beta-lactamase superfamily II)